MSRTTSVSLDDHFTDFIDRQLAVGRYTSASDVVRAGLRLLEEQELKREALRAALIEGETSGTALPFDAEAFLAEKHRGRLAPHVGSPPLPPHRGMSCRRGVR